MEVVTDQEIAHQLPGSGDLAAAPAPAPVGEGEVEELQASGKRRLEPIIGPPSLGPRSTPDLAPDVRELFDERELRPASAGEADVDGHVATRASTVARIAVWRPMSSTPRVWFDCRGLTLIIESNSIQSSAGYASG